MSKMIRLLEVKEFDELVRLHEMYYKNQFPFPDLSQFLCVLADVDDKDRIITAGGIKPILEAILITDESFPVKSRRRALLEMLQSLSFIASRHNYNQIHAFIQTEAWAKQLAKHGFKKCRGEALYLDL